MIAENTQLCSNVVSEKNAQKVLEYFFQQEEICNKSLMPIRESRCKFLHVNATIFSVQILSAMKR